jgi:hypothetical protein
MNRFPTAGGMGSGDPLCGSGVAQTGFAGLNTSPSGYGNVTPHIGFIAQEVQEKYPQAVRESDDGFLMVVARRARPTQ